MLIESGCASENTVSLLPAILEPTPAASLSSLFAGQHVERLASGALFWQGDRATHVFEVVEGVLRIVHAFSDGRRVVAGFLFARDLVGVSVRECYPYTVEAVVPIKVRRLSWGRFEDEITEAPGLRDQLVAHLRDEMASVHSQVVRLAHGNAEERLCGFLMSMARRMNGDRWPAVIVDLPMSRLDIADHLGLTIETVSRAMTRLRQQGVVSKIGRYAVAVRRPKKLAVLSGDDEESGSEEVSIRSN